MIDLFENPLAILEPDRTAADLCVLGIRLGSASGEVPEELLVGHKPDRLTELVRSTLTLALTREGRQVAVVLTIEDGRVQRIRVRGTLFEELHVHHADALLERLGPTDYFDLSHGVRSWQWPQRSLTAEWDGTGQLSFVLGTVAVEKTSRSAVDVLRAALDWNLHYPGRSPFEPPHASRVSAIEAARLTALLLAFGLIESSADAKAERSEAEALNRFFSGDFLEARQPGQIEQLFRRLTELAETSIEYRAGLFCSARVLRHWLWQKLINTRQALEISLQANSGVLESGSGFALLGTQFADRVAERVKDPTAFLDRILGLCIDPTDRRVPMGVLVREFGFPEDDYEAIRMRELYGD
ncbi:MAG: hypothetical protein HY791_11085 [Deltaproteobacteria bacterium]|nr:hypothetical protein [Deltaproteobacteria bacterium]